jgi:hypothetical protein
MTRSPELINPMKSRSARVAINTSTDTEDLKKAGEAGEKGAPS